MKLQISLITTSEELSRYVGLRKGAAVPEGWRTRPIVGAAALPIAVNSLVVNEKTSVADIEEFFFSVAENSEALIVLYDVAAQRWIERYLDCVFAIPFNCGNVAVNANNLLNSILSKALKHFRIYASAFGATKNTKPLLLPFRNFSAKELQALRKLFSSPEIQGFANELETNLALLRNRQSPKKSSTYRVVYYVDDDARYFEYGHEQHARNETAIPPHNAVCILSGNFRFGIRYDPLRHFNVSLSNEKRISGHFLGCHEQRSEISPRSHLNIFPNDHIG
jgi:hypothetical protein